MTLAEWKAKPCVIATLGSYGKISDTIVEGSIFICMSYKPLVKMNETVHIHTVYDG